MVLTSCLHGVCWPVFVGCWMTTASCMCQSCRRPSSRTPTSCSSPPRCATAWMSLHLHCHLPFAPAMMSIHLLTCTVCGAGPHFTCTVWPSGVNPRLVQNPPGIYAGRKTLSRAFRSRFLELHVEDIPGEVLVLVLCCAVCGACMLA